MKAHVFGPVPSRRLGRSLGVDLVPFKTCTYDCVYCQLGPTTRKTVQRRQWVDVDDIMVQLEDRLAAEPDYITISGSGEPTLYARIGELIERIKTMTQVPIAVMTNGSLLWDPAVRQQLLSADLVIPSLDAGDQATFEKINRPDRSIRFDQMFDGLGQFRREFSGAYWLEVFILAGITDSDAQVHKLARHTAAIQPDRVQLNTVARPPTETWAVAVSPQRMDQIARMFDPVAEVIAEFDGTPGSGEFVAGRQEILELLRRRPCSPADIAAGLGIPADTVTEHINDLHARALIEPYQLSGTLYYRAAKIGR